LKEPPPLRDLYREQLSKSIGGWSGSLIVAIPTVVFVIVNSIGTLRAALIAAVASALLLAAYRLVRRQPTQQALGGLLGVLLAALIAGRTGQARNYFVLGIILSYAYALPFLVSILVRRPLIGVLWEFLDPTPGTGPQRRWHRIRALRRAYSYATGCGLALFASRGIVQLLLYLHAHGNSKSATGWLAFARVAMGFPLYLAAVGAGFVIARNARHAVAAEAAEAEPEGGSAHEAEAQGGLGLGQSDEQ
jgi:hypothetical protein